MTQLNRCKQPVGVEGFEPTTSSSQSLHSARLSYTPWRHKRGRCDVYHKRRRVAEGASLA